MSDFTPNPLLDITEGAFTPGAFSSITGRLLEYYTVQAAGEITSQPGLTGFQLQGRPAPSTLQVWVVDTDFDPDPTTGVPDGVELTVITSGTPNVTQVRVNLLNGWCQLHSDNAGLVVACLYDEYGANYSLTNVRRIATEAINEDIEAIVTPIVEAEVADTVPGEVATQIAPVQADLDVAEADIVALQAMFSTDSVLCDTIGTTTAGWGSTDTKVVRFTNVTTTGTAATGASTAATGTTITINTTGLYHVTGVCRYGASGSPSLVVTVNSSALTTDPFQASINGGRFYWQHEGSTGLRNSATISGLLYLTATDVVRLHGLGTTQALHADWRFELRPIFLG
jgi:hypothetical protein